MEHNDKISRILDLYNKFENGETVCKSYEAAKYGVDERSIRRDIDDIKKYYDRKKVDGSGISNRIVYNRDKKGYCLEHDHSRKLSNAQILAVCKILLDGRAFTKKQMDNILGKLIDCCVPEYNQKLVKELIANEQYHYIEPQHKKEFLDTLWALGKAIHNRQYIEISYGRIKDKKTVKRKLKPAAIMFSEFYFYLTAFIQDESTREGFETAGDAYPTIYRIDRIQDITLLDEPFHVPYRDRFEEGEFRKRVQFMFGGKLQQIKFQYSGASLEAILDRLPTAKILSEENGVYTISAEVFGKGIDMWIRSQGDAVKMLRYEKSPIQPLAP